MICSRSTALMRSIFFCMDRNSGISRTTRYPTTTVSSGTETQTSQDRLMSSRSAMMMPPMHMMGVATMKFRPISTSICTCWTSLVPRVISVGAPNVLTSLAEKLVTLRNTAAAKVTAQGHGRLRAEVHAGDGGAHLDKGHERASRRRCAR